MLNGHGYNLCQGLFKYWKYQGFLNNNFLIKFSYEIYNLLWLIVLRFSPVQYVMNAVSTEKL